MPTAVLRIWLFGEVRAEFDGRPVRVAARPLCPVLLAMLAVRPGTRLARETLAAELWPDEADGARVKGNLRRHLFTLQSELPVLPDGAGWIESDRSTVVWLADRPFWCDATILEAALTDPDAGPEAFRLGGDFMRGYASDWVVAQRENYRARAIERLLSLCVERQDDDRIDEALDCANAILQIDPLCEEAAQLAVELHGERGDAISAGQVFAAFAERLQRELEAAPSAATLAAIERVRAAAASRVEKLPRMLTTFVGRGEALENLTGALEGHRCVTIVGPGGVGKTRLSLETARNVAGRFVDGSAFVDLSALPPGSPVVDAVVRGLELPSELASAGTDGIKRFLRNRRMLLILDNCEHVLGACAALAVELLASAPRTTLLATSRAPLAIDAERIYRLDPLSRSEARALFNERTRRVDAAASWADDDLARIERICDALDRSPLAVELVASLARNLGLADIERQLTDRFAVLRTSDPSKPERHRTLEDAIAWSFELLEPPERSLFVLLAVFPASFTFAAALEICDAPAATLLGLVEKSMVQRDERDPDRYRLLFSLGAFAQRRLEGDARESDARDRHARFYAALAAFAESPAYARGEVRWLKEVELELDNVRVALRRLLSAPAGDPRDGIRMCFALERFFNARGYYTEGLDWLAEAEALTASDSPERALVRWHSGKLLMKARKYQPALAAVAEAAEHFRSTSAWPQLARALGELGAIHMRLSNHETARRLLDEASSMAETTGLVRTKAVALGNLGLIAAAEGDEPRAIAASAEAARLFKELGDRRLFALALDSLAGFEFGAGRYETAVDILQEALAAVRDVGDIPLAAGILSDLGDVLLADGRVSEARERFGESLGIVTPLGLPYATGQALLGFAGVAVAAGAAPAAARLIGAAVAYVEELGFTATLQGSLYQRTRKAVVERLGEAEFERQRRLGELMEFDDAVRLAADSHAEGASAGAARPDAYT